MYRQLYTIMATNVVLSASDERKGAKDILDLTGNLSQVCKQYEGIYSKSLPNTKGLTVEAWMSANGVERFVTKSGAKKGYTPGIILGAWHPMMKHKKADGTFQASVYRVRPAKYTDADGETFDVFTYEEAQKRASLGGNNGAVIKRTMLIPVPDTRWSVDTINKGLLQKWDYKKYEEREIEGDLAWEEVDKVYIIRESKNENGELVRNVEEVSKDEVTF